jgi:hypothetical protein
VAPGGDGPGDGRRQAPARVPGAPRRGTAAALPKVSGGAVAPASAVLGSDEP